MASKTKKKSDFKRILSVLLGVLGAGWLFWSGWQGVFDYVTGYRITDNFFTYFFNTGLYPVVALCIAILFFIVSLRDLEPLTKGFSLITAILSAVTIVAFVVYFIHAVTSFSVFLDPGFLLNAGKFLFLFAYLLFALYCRNGGSVKNVAWSFGVAGMLIIIIAAVLGFATDVWGSATLVQLIFTVLAHCAILYCGLRQY